MKRFDLLIKNGRVFNVYLKQFLREDIVISNGKIDYVGDSAALTGEFVRIISAAGKYIIPGLIDIHLHIESSMATPRAFAVELIKNGVTTIVSEPHEIANVFGIEGIRAMMDAGSGAAIDIFYGVPSSVPSTSSQLETTGGAIELPEIAALMEDQRVICLGEVMNCYQVARGGKSKIGGILDFYKQKYPQVPVEGHCSEVGGLSLARVLAAGVTSDHTQQTVATLTEKMKAGMFIELQEKSINPEIIRYIVDHRLEEHIALVTDDVMADRLVRDGHLNRLVRKAVECGMPVETALYCATYTPARRMRLWDRGAIAPGKIADLVLVDEIHSLSIGSVYKNGRLVYPTSRESVPAREAAKAFPAAFYHSIHRAPITNEDLILKAPVSIGEVKCRVIQVNEGTTFTDEVHGRVTVKDGVADWESSPYGLIGVLERHGQNNAVALGLIAGNTIRRGAVATSCAHDHHNLLVVGKNVADMVLAVNTVIANQGGYAVVEDGQLLAKLDLPIGGILSDKDLETIGGELAKVTAAMRMLGYVHANPVMSLSTNGLPVSRLLKITDQGLIRVDQQKIVDIWVEDE